MRIKGMLSYAIFGLMLLSATAFGQDRPIKADPVAWNALRDTRETRYYLPANCAGFSADLTINDNGQVSQAILNYDVGTGADLRITSGIAESKQPWALEMVLNMIGHRRRPAFEEKDGRFPITFAAEDNSPNGRGVLLNDPARSSYRIRNGRVTEVDRTVGDHHFVISIMEELLAEQGRYLPRHFTVTYFDAQTDDVRRTETFTDEYKLIDGVWLPASRRVFKAEHGHVITRIIQFKNLRVRFKSAQGN